MTTFAEILGEEIRLGKRGELYDGQRAQLQAEYEAREEQRQEAEARAKADLERAVDAHIEKMKKAGTW